MRAHDRTLLWLGIGLVVVAIAGMAVVGPSGTVGDRHGWMYGWMHGADRWDGGSSSPAPSADAPTVTVVATEFAFSPDRIEIPAGAVNIRLENRGAVLHDLTVPDLGIRLVAGPGETVEAGYRDLPPGTYRALCTVPGHAQAGMVATVVVEP